MRRLYLPQRLTANVLGMPGRLHDRAILVFRELAVGTGVRVVDDRQ
ncbi:hypothetical protein ACFWAN_37840 [Streptomyces mirabilis]